MRVAYADPPYLGCCGLYDHYHPDGKCWDDLETHAGLIARLEDRERLETYDGWVLHLSSPSLSHIAPLIPDGARVMAWVKPFAAFKANIPVAYAWEPVIVKPCRKPVVSKRLVLRDWIAEGITMQRGLTGAKPADVCRWAFEVAGMEQTDELYDLFPGSGAVTRAWNMWRNELRLDLESEPRSMAAKAAS